MTKSELITALTRKSSALSEEDVHRVVRCILDLMVTELANGGRVEVRGFGALSLRTIKARIGRNPRTGASVSVPVKHSVRFKGGLELRKRVDRSADEYEITS